MFIIYIKCFDKVCQLVNKSFKRDASTTLHTLIVGDFNLCYDENHHNPLIQGLIQVGFRQLIQDPTHLRGRVIDHAYIRDPDKITKIFVERYSPYNSDHDAICITLIQSGF